MATSSAKFYWQTDEFRLTKAIALISLDRTKFFVDLIALKEVYFDIKQVTRNYIKSLRQFKEENVSEKSYFTFLSDQVSREVADFTVEWQRAVFAKSFRDFKDLDAWLMFFCWAERDEKKLESLFRKRDQVDQTRSFIRDAKDRDPYYERSSLANENALSDWDLHMYVVQEWNEDKFPPDGPGNYYYATFSRIKCQAFINNVVAFLEPEDLSHLWERAIEMSAADPERESLPALVSLEKLVAPLFGSK